MKTKLHSLIVVLALFASVHPARAQNPIITSFSQNGVLVCSNLNPSSVASVEWASSLAGPWQTNWVGLDTVAVDSNKVIQVSVPMFYRVRGVAWTNPAPTTTADGTALIPTGSFTMGDTLDGESDAVPMIIYVSAFYMDTNLVSYSQWQTVYSYATNHGYGFVYGGSGKATNHPVQMVNWYDCVKWCNARSQLAGLTPVYYTDADLTQVYANGQMAPYVNWTNNGYRLPTEAEWEKAARGGLNGQRFPWGMTISETQANYYAQPGGYDLGPYSGYNTNFDTGGMPYTSPVGYFAPNGYGLYDMAGNVWEWCWDRYGTPYGQPTTNNPTGPASGSNRVFRGDSYADQANGARCANRNYNAAVAGNVLGFRCVRKQ